MKKIMIKNNTLITKNNWAFQKEPPDNNAPFVCLGMQEVVNLSEFFLLLHSAILYGLIDGELPNQERCLHYLELGKAHGVFPVKGWLPPKDFLIEMGFKSG